MYFHRIGFLWFAGRDSPDLRSDSMGRSSPDPHALAPASQPTGPSRSQDGLEDDGQAEDLVSDVQLRAQSASLAAVAAGQEQQLKVSLRHSLCFVSEMCV